MKADGERRLANLLGEQVLLVEEEDDARLLEPLVVADGIKQLHRLHHSILKRDNNNMNQDGSRMQAEDGLNAPLRRLRQE